jgi:hypothetical protein
MAHHAPPKASPIAWWPRQTPKSGTPAPAAARVSGRQMPACAGSQGPGDSTIASGFIASASCTVSASLRTTWGVVPSSPK